MDFGVLRSGYRTIFANPNTLICYGAVFVEGCCIFGLFPFVAAFLFDIGITSPSIAGLVLACFAVGGLLYTGSVSRLLPRLGVKGMMIGGGLLMAVQYGSVAFGPPWQLQALNLFLMGLGFYMLHGSIQVFSSELSETARATAMSLHAFCFFLGQTIGPIAYGFGLAHFGKSPTVLTSGVVLAILGFVCARLLRQIKPADAADVAV
jgi:predicted MFS family arabinose efflux permease